jgi:hypothetical protein
VPAASFQVLFGGQPADDDFYDSLTTLEVEENADLPGAIQLTLPISTSGSEDLTILGDQRFAPYANVAVVISVDGQANACIFDGYVLSHQVRLDKGVTASSVRVWGQDASCLMNLDEKTHEWTESDGVIANTIFGGDPYGFSTATENTEDDSGGHPETGHTVMQRGTDAQFLRDRARRAGRLFRVACIDQPGKYTGYFIKPKVTGADPATTLVLNPPEAANVDSLDIEWDVARPSEVKAQALVLDKDPVDGGVQDSGLDPLDGQSLAALAADRAMKVMLTTAVDNVGELQARARSVLREAGWFVKCEGEADLARLNHVLRVATLVEVNGAGNVHSGNYFVWSVRHTITAESHRMKFVLVRNALGQA